MDIKSELHTYILKLRSIERIITQESFERLYDNADDQEEIERYIINEDRYKIDNWIHAKKCASYSEMSLQDLREVARRFNIPYYSRLHKSTLLSEIVNYEQSYKTIS